MTGRRAHPTPSISPTFGVVTAVAGVVLSLSACGSSATETIDVYAASSLVDIMEQLEERYEAQHPEVDIRLNLAGTNALIRQINSGAEADLLVAADASLLADLDEAPLAEPQALATNRLTLVVPDDNPGAITAAGDLDAANASDMLLVARCAAGVPCGRATDAFLQAEGLSLGRTTDEANVRSVLSKVAAGEVDAGFVYHTDAVSTDQVIEIELDDAPTVTVTLARLDDAPAAADLAAYLGSDEAAVVFVELGFEPPSAEGTEGAGR